MIPRTHTRRAPRRAALIVLVMAALVLLGGCGESRPGPSASQHGRAPERTPEQAAYDLLDALLTSQMTVELPPGYAAPPPGAALRLNPNQFVPSTQALGGVFFPLAGPN